MTWLTQPPDLQGWRLLDTRCFTMRTLVFPAQARVSCTKRQDHLRNPGERERTWALVSARAEGISIRALAAALGELRAAGWPAPEDPDSDEDADLARVQAVIDRIAADVDELARARR